MTDGFDLAEPFMAGLKQAGEMKWEYVEWFLRGLKVSQEQVNEAVQESLYEWDLG